MNNALIDEFLNSGKYSPNTRYSYERSLRAFLLAFPDCREVSSSQLSDWLNRDEWGSNTQSVMLYAVKGFLRFHFGSSHPALSLKIKRGKSAPRKSLKSSDIQRLLSSFDTTTEKGIRDLAMAGVFLDCALRVAEVARLDVRQLDLRDVRLSVVVKGGEWDVRTFSDQTAVWLAEWLHVRKGMVVPGQMSVFLGLWGTRKVKGQWVANRGYGLTTDGVKQVVKDWKEDFGFDRLHGHLFRHSFATLTTRNGAPKSVAMRGGGWRNEDVFENYVQDLGVDDVRPYLPVKHLLNI